MRSLRSAIKGAPCRSNRRGTAAVEFAITAPFVFMVVFALIEFARLTSVANSVENAAYEAARRAIVPGATASQAQASGNALLSGLGISGGTITISPATITNSTPEVTATVVVPMGANTWVTPVFSPGKTITRSITLTREKTS